MAQLEVTVTVDASKLIADMKGLERHIPYALARTLTKTALGAQMAVELKLPSQFTLRNNFTERGIKYKAAQKSASVVEAMVYTDTTNRATGAPDYLGKQETGGMRVPHNGRMHIAIPMPALWQLLGGKSHIIPRVLRPKNLLAAGQFGGIPDFRYRRNKSSGEMERKLFIIHPKLIRGWEFFQPKDKGGRPTTPYIFGRKAGASAKDIHAMYKLVPEVQMTPKLGMVPTVETYVTEHFEEEWQKIWVEMAQKGIRL